MSRDTTEAQGEVRWVSVERSEYDEDAARIAIGFKVGDADKLQYVNLQFGGETSEKQEKYGSMILSNLLKGRAPVDLELSEGRNGRTDIFVPRVEDESSDRPARKATSKRRKEEPEEEKEDDYPF